MNKPLEISVELLAVGLAEDAGWFVQKLEWVGRRGAPDRMFVKDKRFVLIEFKRPGATATTQQKREHTRCRAAGFEVYVCCSVEEALSVLNIL